MLIYRNAEGVHGQRKFGNPCATLYQCFGHVSIVRVINRIRAATQLSVHNVFCYPTLVYILTHSLYLAFGPKSGFKNECRLGLGSGFKMRSVHNSVSAIEALVSHKRH